MPITQTRAISLINAALDFKQALTTLIESIHAQRQPLDNPNNPLTAINAFEYLESIANPTILLNHPESSPTTIALEHYHFSRNARRNERHAKKAAEKRRQQNVPIRRAEPFPYENSSLTTFAGNAKPSQYENRRAPTPTTTFDDPLAAAYPSLSQSDRAKILAQVDEDLANSAIPSCPNCGTYDVYSCPRGISNCKWHERIIQLEAETAAKADEDFEEGLN